MNASSRVKTTLYIVIPILAAILIIAAAAIYYYFFYLAGPNIIDSEENFISSDTDGTAVPGQEVTYSINIENSANTDMEDIRIETSIPQNTSFISSEPQASSDDNGSLVFDISRLERSSKLSVIYTVRIDQPCDNGTQIAAEDVDISYSSRSKRSTFNLESDIKDVVESRPVLQIEDFSFEDKNGGDINSGDILVFTFMASNNGDMVAKDVDLVFSLNENLDLLNASTEEEITDISQSGLSWLIGLMDINDPVKVSFEVMVAKGLKDGEDIEVKGSLIYEENKVDSISLSGKVVAFADLGGSSVEVADLDGGDLWAGDIIRYTLRIKNTGLSKAESFTVYCPSPENTFYVNRSGTPQEGIAWSDEIRGITWQIDGLGIGEELVLALDFRVSESMTGGGSITSGFYIEEGQREYDIADVTADVSSYIFQTIVAMGDSHIVHTNWPGILDNLLENTYPRAEFNTIGSGVPQEMAYQGVRRFDSTVATYNPQVIVIGYGTNDTGGGINLFRNGLDELVKKAKGTGATVLVHSIGYIDKVKRPAKKSFLSYNEVIREVCNANGVPYIDLYSPMAADPGRYLDADGMHWSAEGGSLLAHLVYNTLINYLDPLGRRK